MTIPNGPGETATFGTSSLTNVVMKANTSVAQIIFSAGADAYSVAPAPNITLTITGTGTFGSGITNNSGRMQTLLASGDATTAATIQFTGSATAGNQTKLIASSRNDGGPSGRLQFLNSSTGGTARVQLLGNGTLDISAQTYPFSVVDIGSLEGNGTVLLGGQNLRLFGISATTEFAGSLQGTTGARDALSRGDPGTLILSGTSTYSGSTSVAGGRLLVNTSNGAATGTRPIYVRDAGVLGGNGTITSPVNIGAGGTLLLGDATVASGGLTLSNNLNMNFNGSGSMQIVLGPAGSHSTLHRAGGTWTFGSMQGFSVINAGAEVGMYRGIITGLTGNPQTSFYLEGFGISGSFSYDGAGNVDLNLVQAPVPPKVTSAVSRKIHGSAGTFEIDLPLAGQPGLECRSGGTTGNYMLIVSFNGVVTGGVATVTSGIGSVTGTSFDGNAAINLTGVTDAQTITITLSGVRMAGGVLPDTPLRMSVLMGDVTANGMVNSSDISQVKSQSGQTVTAANFRNDVTADGAFTASDIGLVKSRAGGSLP